MKCGVLTSLIVFLYSNAVAQHFFTIETDGLSRSYLVVTPSPEPIARLPVVIVLHDDGIIPVSLAKLNWSQLRRPSIVVFPVGLMGKWNCLSTDSIRAMNDVSFISKLIREINNSYKTDPTRVFMVGMGASNCMVNDFVSRYPKLVRGRAQWNYQRTVSPGQVFPEPARQLDSLSLANPSTHVETIKPAHAMISSRNYMPYEKKMDIFFHVGRWQQSPGKRTDFDSLTLVDLAKYHLMFGVQLEYNFTPSIATFIETELMIIPKEQNINSISWGGGQGVNVKASGKGGIVIPYGIGFKYSFEKNKIRPFLSASGGRTYIYLGGGKASGGIGSISKTITKRKESPWRYTFGGGLDARMAPQVSFRFYTGYCFGSSLEPPMGSITNFEGLSIQLGLVFILSKK